MEHTNPSLSSWQDLTLKDLVHAYKKAKADCFFERTICVAQKFVAYEANLLDNLNLLLDQLHQGRGGAEAAMIQSLGSSAVVAKKLASAPKEDGPSRSHGFFSDPHKAFENLRSTHDLTPEFRLVGDFDVNMHIISALWINTTGHIFDERLKNNVYGSRLRRYRAAPGRDTSARGDYHIHGLGSFEPYFEPYRKWRADGLRAAKTTLEQGQKIIAVSLDLKSYYHEIDPSFIANDHFHEKIGVSLNGWQKEFTSALVVALQKWSRDSALRLEDFSLHSTDGGGIPIGLACARLIANVLLHEWDTLVLKQLTPLFYGRYVDDILMVLIDPGDLPDASAWMKFLCQRMESTLIKEEGKQYAIKLTDSYAGTSRLLLQEEKNKLFFLHGRGGLDLLDSIEQEIASVASERRLMPDLDALDRSAAARVLSAAGSVAIEADTLRRADGLSVRRLGWSIQLKNVETFARDLSAHDWIEERNRFYEFSLNHVLRPDRILDHMDYLPRLLALAVDLRDWSQAIKLVISVEQALTDLQNATPHRARINGHDVSNSNGIWAGLRERMYAVCREALLRAYPWRAGKPIDLPEQGKILCEKLQQSINPKEFRTDVVNLRNQDWARIPYREHYIQGLPRRKREAQESSLVPLHHSEAELREFLKYARKSAKATGLSNRKTFEIQSLMPFVFPTRPFTAEEIALYVPDCIHGRGDNQGENWSAAIWARYVKAVRGAWVRPQLLSESEEHHSDGDDPPVRHPGGTVRTWLRVGRSASPRKIRLGLTSLLTSEQSWTQGANGKSDLGRKRYKQINGLVNAAIQAEHRPHYFLLPEVSLPEPWVRSISKKLMDAGINLIAGLDYRRVGKSICSHAVLVLTDDRLGYRSTIQIRQKKSQPAPQEDYDLQHKFGCTWQLDDFPKPVYEHSGFCFGVLVCSELQNIHHRHRFQGKTDAVFVLSWNRDLDTFSALVESAALDVHTYIVLVNNRQYGDSRVRSPAKESHNRDKCRLRGGENDYLVVVEVDPKPLREFQSRERSWPKSDDRFKPVPEGFKIAQRRRTLPG